MVLSIWGQKLGYNGVVIELSPLGVLLCDEYVRPARALARRLPYNCTSPECAAAVVLRKFGSVAELIFIGAAVISVGLNSR